MVKVISTVKLREDMLQTINDEFDSFDFEYINGNDLTDGDRRRAEIYVTYGGDIKDRDVEHFTSLRWIMVMSAGVDDMPLDKLQGVKVTNATGIHRIQMTEYTVGLILNHYKNFTQLRRDQDNREWRGDAKTIEICGKEVHILGTGSIGSRLAEVLSTFGLQTVGYNTNGRVVPPFDENQPLEDLLLYLGSADIVVNILPSTEDTRQLLTTSHFKQMKDDAIFINIGRGDVVSDEVVLETLTGNYISHMILDVFNEEPLPSTHPFYQLDNITITPHASSKTSQYLERAFDIFIYNLKRYNDEKNMKNAVSHRKGY